MGCNSTVRLGDVIRLEDAKREPISARRRNERKGTYPYFGAQGVVDHLNDYTYEGEYLLVAEDGENLRSRKQPIANAVSGRFRGNNHAHVLRGTERCNLIYLRHLLNSMDISGYITGSTQPKLSQFNLLNITMALPDIDTQNVISFLLKSFDEKISLNNRLNGYLEELADSLFQDMFARQADNATLADVASVTMGQSPAGASYNEKGVGAVFYQGRGEFGWRFPTQRLFTTAPKRMAAVNDVLMSVRAPVGDLNVAYEDCCIGRGLAAISSDHHSFCLYLMRSLKRKLDAFNGEGTVFGSINGKALKGLPVYAPPASAIEAFEAKASPIDKLISTNEAENRKLEKMRDTLLPKLMSGEIDVSKVDLTQLNSHLVPPMRDDATRAPPHVISARFAISRIPSSRPFIKPFDNPI